MNVHPLKIQSLVKFFHKEFPVLMACLVAGLTMAGPAPETETASPEHGRHLFETHDFGGNGRTCVTCHRSDQRHLAPEQVRALFASNPADPLFRHDGADGFSKLDTGEHCVAAPTSGACAATGAAEICREVIQNGVPHECRTGFSRLLTHATIRAEIPLHPNVIVPGAEGSVYVNRAVPSTHNIVLDPVLMADGRAPDLRAQALDALLGHAGAQEVDPQALEAVVAFESSEFSSASLAAFAAGGDELKLPAGNTETEKRGREFFITPAQIGKEGFCGMCHAGPMLNEVGVQIQLPGPLKGHGGFLEAEVGDRFSTALVSLVNADANPLRVWGITEGDDIRVVMSPDIGRAAITGKIADIHKFKIPTLWGSARRAPFFHDNSAKTLRDMVDLYGDFMAPTFGVELTEQDREDIIAYLKLLQ